LHVPNIHYFIEGQSAVQKVWQPLIL